ncbi:MAG: tetratricopeptide repeat protein, partial [Saprospiraceae bacterium]
MKQSLKYTFLFLFMGILGASAQNGHVELREGDAAYKSEDYAKAEEEYLRALEENPESVKGHFNRANAIYKGLENAELESEEELTKRLDKAAEEYQSAIQNTDNDDIKANAYHNLGNTMVQKQDLEKGIEAYKNALRLNPDDLNTKKNLYLTQKYLQQQQQQEEQQSEDGEQGEGEPQEGEQQEQQQESQEQQENQENQSSEQQESQEQKEQEQQESQSEQ